MYKTDRTRDGRGFVVSARRVKGGDGIKARLDYTPAFRSLRGRVPFRSRDPIYAVEASLTINQRR